MIYKVVKSFTDLQDNHHVYSAGDRFPREGVEVSEDRLEELSGSNNKLGRPLIERDKPVVEEVPEEKPKKTTRKKRG